MITPDQEDLEFENFCESIEEHLAKVFPSRMVDEIMNHIQFSLYDLFLHKMEEDALEAIEENANRLRAELKENPVHA